MGLVSVAARVGGILSPYLSDLGSVSPNLHLLVFGAMTLSAGIFNLRLPETQGLALPETVQDMQKRMNQVSGDKKRDPKGGYHAVPQVQL